LSQLYLLLSGIISVAAAADALTQFLFDLQVPQKLQQWQDESLAEGDAQQASIYKQVWQKVMGLWQEVKDFLAEERWPAEDICAVFDAALSDMQLSVVPPGLDEVFVASLDRSRNPQIKVAFVLGANEGKLPAKIMQDGLFTAQDRLDLAEAGLELAPAVNSRQLAENYLLYVALTRAEEKLYLSYCLQDEGGQEEKPSWAVERLRQLFPQLTTQMYGRDEGLHAITGGIGTVAELAKQLSAQASGQNIPAYWRDVYNYYMKNDEMRELMHMVMRGLRFEPPRYQLQKKHIEHLFGKNLRSSVSRLEKFRACPLSYFATYSLKLRKRPLYELNALDRGQLFHEVLSVIGQRIEAEKIDWHEIDEAKAGQLVDEAMQPLLPRFLGNILASSARYAYLAQRMKNTLKITLLLWAQHMQKGSFRPIAWELKFGGDGLLPALKIPLDDGRCLEIHGQIDRVDMAAGEEKTWFRVVDYKTGQQSVTVRDIFQGLKLQLLLYLQLVLDNSGCFGVQEQMAAGAGLYYSFVRDDMSNISLSDLAKEEERNLCGLRLAGISVKDAEAVLLADQDCDGHSALIPVAMKADGSFWGNSSGISSRQLSFLRGHLLDILRQTASAMLEGLIVASPQGMGNFSACSYCDYRDFCGFDLQLMTAKEQPELLSEEQIWQSLEQGVSGDE
jgi:ATP-dependent helicase/nuclease subunit B